MRRWIAFGGIILLVVALSRASWPSAPDPMRTLPETTWARISCQGVVTEAGIVGLPFGVTAAVAEASLGAPGEFTSTLHPTPTLRQGGKWWGFHCARRNNHPCHTYFGFVNGRFTTFCTQSAPYRTPNGSHPGLSMAKARRDPDLSDIGQEGFAYRWDHDIPRLAVTAVGHRLPRVSTLYATSGKPAFRPNCSY